MKSLFLCAKVNDDDEIDDDIDDDVLNDSWCWNIYNIRHRRLILPNM